MVLPFGDLNIGAEVFSIRNLAKKNRTYRKVLLEGEHTEITVMRVTDEIPLEIHEDRDQFIYIVSGEVNVTVYTKDSEIFEEGWGIGERFTASEDEAIFIPSFVPHEIKRISKEPVKLFSVYSF